MIKYDYQYDLIHHPFLSEFIDETSEILTQAFIVPEGVSSFQGIHFKVSKYGEPGPIHFGIGSQPGENDLFLSVIQPEEVVKVFELFVGANFAPIKVTEGNTYYLNIQVSKGKAPLDAYKIYGPNITEGVGDEENYLLPYWWSWYVDEDNEIEISLPQNYKGANYPDFNEGFRFDSEGNKTWSIAFEVKTNLDSKTEDTQKEQIFEFVKSLVAPPFSEWKNIRNDHQNPGSEEVEVTGDWCVRNFFDQDPVFLNVYKETFAFFSKVMGVDLQKSNSKGHYIEFRITQDSKDIPEGDESFVVFVDSEKLLVVSRTNRGLLRGLHWLEDQIILRQAPFITKGEHRVVSNYSLRMVPGIYPAIQYYKLQQAQIWTEGYIWRLARAGYNTIYFQANIEELVEDSAIFHEMNHHKAKIAIERLRRTTAMAESFGIDVYLDIKTGYMAPFNENVYERVPEIKSFKRHGDYPCSGQDIVLKFYYETINNVFNKTKLKGLIIIYDTEGFYTCFLHGKKDQCHFCKNFSVEDLSTRFFNVMKSAVEDARNDGELVLWSYFCDADWNYQVIDAIPSGITLMSCFSQFAEIDRFGTKVKTDDYSLVSEDPSDYFLKLKEKAKNRGLRFYAKTEDTFGQEFVSTYYTPCLTQHQRRWDEIAKHDVDGVMAQYIHIGFMPNPCCDLSRENFFTKVNIVGMPESDGYQKLLNTAKINYGDEVSHLILKAWDFFSQAMRDFFPYAWGVTRYPGPLQASPALPFLLDPTLKPPRTQSRGFVYNLKWTEIDERFLVEGVWNSELISRCFFQMINLYKKGLSLLTATKTECHASKQKAVQDAIHVAETQMRQMLSIVNYINFIKIRDSYLRINDEDLLNPLVTVCLQEQENAQVVLDLLNVDSRIGFSCEGAGTVRGGLFTAAGIESKLVGLAETINTIYGWIREIEEDR